MLGLSRAAIAGLAVCGVVIVGGIDYLTGHEVSWSLFYLGPVAVAAWYGSRWYGVGIAVVSCVSWYVADMAAGNEYSHPAIAVWNALIRLGFFAIASLLLTALRDSLLSQRHLAQTDGLTELCSRRAFEDRLQHDLALGQRRGTAVTLAYVDMDDLKALNDAHGHREGDRALRAVGTVLKSSLRRTDMAARIGGDEFALVLPDTGSLEAQQVIRLVAHQLHHASTASGLEFTCTIGVVTSLDPGLSAAEVLEAADALMYEVKRKGKRAVAFKLLRGEAQRAGAADAPSPGRRVESSRSTEGMDVALETADSTRPASPLSAPRQAERLANGNRTS